MELKVRKLHILPIRLVFILKVKASVVMSGNKQAFSYTVNEAVNRCKNFEGQFGNIYL